MIEPPSHPRFPTYLQRRNDGPGHRPFPVGVPPINVSNTNGTIVFESHAQLVVSVYRISPVFADPIRLTIEDNRITKIEGKDEADALRRFLKSLEPKLGI